MRCSRSVRNPKRSAVEALRAYLPDQARVMRDGQEQVVPARELVPGDLLLVEEGERVSADARLLSGAVDVDMSTLTGESLPASRFSSVRDTHVPLLHARELLFTGTTCVAGTATGAVYATCAHRAGSHRGAEPAGTSRGEPAGAPGPPRCVAHRHGRGRRRSRVPAARSAGWANLGGCGCLCRRPARRERPRGATADDHARAVRCPCTFAGLGETSRGCRMG